jgi:deoxyribodipyrimidine photolyase-related protein
MNFILFPNQLFELKYIPKKYLGATFHLIEHEKFYGITDKMNFNKKKILLHKASCLAYVQTMKKKLKIEYVSKYPTIKNSTVIFFDTIDTYLNDELIKFYKKDKNEISMLETPNFVTNRIDLEKYYKKNKKGNKFIHSSFYNFQLDLHNIPSITKSYDTENRNPIPHDIKIPQAAKQNNDKYVKQAINFVKKKFDNNYGNTDNFYLPITHQQAKKFFNLFLKNKAKFFAQYQDAIIPQEPFLFHSVLSSAMNIGLINPDYVITNVIKAYQAKKISLKDYEAFIRQVIGWREYQRFIYIYLGQEIKSKNYFNNSRKLTEKWYTATVGISPVDDAIKIAFDYGYLHHIIRLMVMCNFMNLCQIHPDEVYTWMMEFSTDSYEWVMIGNVYSMGMWSDGGMTMQKPYISSANYVQKMAGNRYKKGEWEDIWYALYYNFLIINRKKLEKTIYIRNISHLQKLSPDQIRNIKKMSELFITKVTRK